MVEQFGVPQEIYDWPATRFVAQFIGSPPMNFLDFHGTVGKGVNTVELEGTGFDIPPLLDSASGDLTFGVRPEHIRLDSAAPYKGRIAATEYLGTTQIVSLDTPNGAVKARIESHEKARIGELTGMHFDPRTITLFDAASGRALLSEANQGVLQHG